MQPKTVNEFQDVDKKVSFAKKKFTRMETVDNKLSTIRSGM